MIMSIIDKTDLILIILMVVCSIFLIALTVVSFYKNLYLFYKECEEEEKHSGTLPSTLYDNCGEGGV